MGSTISRRTFVGTGAAALACLGLAACEDDSSEGSDDSSSTTTVDTEGTRTITAGLAQRPSGLDPLAAGSVEGIGLSWHVLEGLYGIDFHDYGTFAELAAGDPVQVDDTTYEVTIRDGATFSDGTAVTAEDVATSFASYAASVTYGPLLASIASVEAKDDRTLTVTTTVANHSLLRERLALVRVTPAERSTEGDERPIGSGPWCYDLVSDAAVELLPNPNYAGDLPAQDARIYFDLLADADSRVATQQEGSTLVMESVPADAIDGLEGAGCRVDVVQGFGPRFLMFDVTKAPWNDVRVRQAVLYALDVDEIITSVFGGLASPVTSFLPDTFAAYHETSTVYSYDPDRAQALIEEAAITPGAITLRTIDEEGLLAMAELVRQDLDALGFRTTVVADTSSATYEAIDQGEAYDLLLAFGDPSRLGGDADLLLRWWYGDGVWMRTRCPWAESEGWAELQEAMDAALGAQGDERQAWWNTCFDLLAENVALYPVVHVKTATACWDDASAAPGGVGLEGFSGIGTTSLDLLGCKTVSA